MLVAGRYVHPNSLFARLSKITDYRLTRYYQYLRKVISGSSQCHLSAMRRSIQRHRSP